MLKLFYFKVGGVIQATSNAAQKDVFPAHGFVTQKMIVEIIQMKKTAVRKYEFIQYLFGQKDFKIV